MTLPPWISYWGMTQMPFSKDIDDTLSYLSPSRMAIVDEVIEAIAARSNIVITGEPGVGKTCILRAIKMRLPETGYRLTYCCNATLGRRDFYRQLCQALGLPPASSAAALFYEITNHVQDMEKDKVYPVFLLDEAHLLHQDTLDHLHILLNYHWDSRALLSLVLVGLPELQDRLALRRNRSLASRLHHRFPIVPLTVDDTRAYLELRLGQAGQNIALFSHDALGRLHQSTSGVLRDIDRLATAALRESAKKKRKTVERDVIDRIAQQAPTVADTSL
jgi:type II secretory pathway predicted ATPase ExeA